MSCCDIGRDLIRIIHDITSIPDISELWNDILDAPEKLSPKFEGVENLLQKPTPDIYLECRLTPDMKEKLLFMLKYVSGSETRTDANKACRYR